MPSQGAGWNRSGRRSRSRKPLIILTWGDEQADVHLRSILDYAAAVEEAGGLPLIVPVPYRIRRGPDEDDRLAGPLARELLAAADGLLLTGGGDIDPRRFGQEPHPALGRVEAARDRLELALARETVSSGCPVLGICRGAQVLAVALGGSLLQDLPSDRPGCLQHRQEAPRSTLTHSVVVEPGTLLAGLLRPGRLEVNSFHHQAVLTVPDGFRVSAVAPDGVIEAIEAAGTGGGGVEGYSSMVLGVQWHPENLWAAEPIFLNLFAGLVEAAGRPGRRGPRRGLGQSGRRGPRRALGRSGRRGLRAVPARSAGGGGP